VFAFADVKPFWTGAAATHPDEFLSTNGTRGPDHGGDSPVKIGREPWRR